MDFRLEAGTCLAACHILDGTNSTSGKFNGKTVPFREPMGDIFSTENINK